MDPVSLPAAAAPVAHDLSFVALFLQADPIVKGVMVLLVLASLGTWTIIVERLLRLAAVRRAARRFERSARAGTVEGAEKGPAAGILAAGIAAAHDRDASETRAERRERLERAMRGELAGLTRSLQTGLPFLATTGSAAPFIGLFGTVWGIMNSFSAIAKSQDTSLAVVAPGIAEALFATAIGLVAAIPAVIAYNKFSTDLSRIGQTFTAGISHWGDRLARDGARAAAE